MNGTGRGNVGKGGGELRLYGVRNDISTLQRKAHAWNQPESFMFSLLLMRAGVSPKVGLHTLIAHGNRVGHLQRHPERFISS